MTSPSGHVRLINRPLARRRFLALAGCGLVGSMMVRLDREARGIEPTSTRRFILYNHCNGLQNHHLEQSTVDGPSTFTLRSFMEAFVPHQSALTVVQNLYCSTGRYLHGNGSCALACADRGPPDGAAGISPKVVGGVTIDQLIATALQEQDPDVKLRTLVLGHPLTISNGNCVQGTIIGTGDNEPLYPILDAEEAHQTIFGVTNQDEVLRDLQKSYLDFVKDDIQAFEAELPGQERQKMQQYLDSVREVEKSFTNLANCDEIPAQSFEHQTHNFPEYWRYMQDLAVIALSCGATRQATMLHTYGCVHFNYTFDGETKNHHERVSHEEENGPFMEKILRFHADQVVYLYERLAEIPEGDGTMADGLLIQWMSDGGGRHHNGADRHPVVFLGAAGGAMNTGQWLRFSNDEYSLACAHVTAARAMGLELDTFGDGQDPCNGPLPGALA
ncbi:MAG: DUF1552 domain-containing protein [Myxococcota bacterium]